VKGVAVHWTVTPARDDHAQCVRDWAGVIAQHQHQGYNPPPAYNYGVCPHGVRLEGRTWARRSAANGTTEANLNYWAIVALNAPGDIPSDAMLRELAALIDEAPDLEARNVRPHSDFYATQCCGDELRHWIATGAGAPGVPTPDPEDDDMGRLVSDRNGWWWVLHPSGWKWRVFATDVDDLAFLGQIKSTTPADMSGHEQTEILTRYRDVQAQ
jgi:hypothetical protein